VICDAGGVTVVCDTSSIYGSELAFLTFSHNRI
jgi:hypothetical protein